MSTLRPTLSINDAEALDEFARLVRQRLGPRLLELRLFGSKARGDATAESDLDVLVLIVDHRVESEDIVLDIAFDVNLAHGVYISPRVIERSILDHPVWKLTPFVQVLERESITL